VALAAATLVTCPAHAERWAMDASVGSQFTRTSNALLGSGGGEVADTVVGLNAGFAVLGEGARLKIAGSAGLSGVGYLDHTVAKQALLQADLNARLEAIERLFFVEMGYRAAQTSADPFGARPDSTSAIGNSRTTSQWRFSPSLESTVGADLRYRVRSDNTWTSEIGTQSDARVANAGGYFVHHSALIERDPIPFGWRVEAERAETRYANSATEPLTSDLARVGLRYRIDTDVTLGLRAGSERNNFVPSEQTGSTYGFDAQWQPSPRTAFSASLDHRFFGSSWAASFLHRQPRWALIATLSRNIDTTPQALFELPPTNDVAALLDAMFTTRFPDPLQRLQVVRDLIAQQGLPGATLGPATLYAQRVSIVTAQRVSLAFTGVRSTFAVSGFSVRTRDALDSGPLVTGTSVTNNTQYGATIVFSHRLSALIGVNVGLDWSSIRALQSIAADRTTQRNAQVQVSAQLAPKTSAHVGARYRQLGSNVVNDGNEHAVFVGADHRF
jgi:uncharacterized protein (PEP-CTERM system associated)